MESDVQIQRAIEALLGDYIRQGERLTQDQVNRVAGRRGLAADGVAAVLQALTAEGVEIEGIGADTLGYEARSPSSSGLGPRANDTLDGLSLYLADVGKVRLLTPNEEQQLGMRIHMGAMALAELCRQTRMTSWSRRTDPRLAEEFRAFAQRRAEVIGPGRNDHMRVLEHQAGDGHEAFEHLILANLRLVISIARPYVKRSGMEFRDLAQEGCLGLIRAVEKFDATRGLKFSTYATWWIRQSLQRAIADKGTTVRLPVHVRDKRIQLTKARRALANEIGHDPTTNEVAAHLGWDPSDVAAIDDLARFDNIKSLDAPVGEGEAELADLIPDGLSVDPLEVMFTTHAAEAIDSVLDTLTEREASVVKLRFGIGGNKPLTLEQVGTRFGLTRERIRQIEHKALAKLRHPVRASVLREFADIQRPRAPEGDDPSNASVTDPNEEIVA